MGEGVSTTAGATRWRGLDPVRYARSRPAPQEAAAFELGRPAAFGGKRAFDAISAFILIVLFTPLVLLVALAVKLSSPGPVLFRQRRVGHGGQLFDILKFRTMHHDAEARLSQESSLRNLYLTSDHKIPVELDPRITPVGRFL